MELEINECNQVSQCGNNKLKLQYGLISSGDDIGNWELDNVNAELDYYAADTIIKTLVVVFDCDVIVLVIL